MWIQDLCSLPEILIIALKPEKEAMVRVITSVITYRKTEAEKGCHLPNIIYRAREDSNPSKNSQLEIERPFPKAKAL